MVEGQSISDSNESESANNEDGYEEVEEQA